MTHLLQDISAVSVTPSFAALPQVPIFTNIKPSRKRSDLEIVEQAPPAPLPCKLSQYKSKPLLRVHCKEVMLGKRVAKTQSEPSSHQQDISVIQPDSNVVSSMIKSHFAK